MLANIQHRHRTLAFGATAVSVLVAGALHVWDDRLLVSIAFLGFVPMVCAATIIQWAGHVLAMERVDAYLTALARALREGY